MGGADDPESDEQLIPFPRTLLLKAKTMKTKTAKSANPPRTTLHKLAKAVCLREQAKAMWEEAAQIENDLLAELPVGKQIDLPDGRSVTIRDQFAEKQTVWCHTPCQRFKFEVSKE